METKGLLLKSISKQIFLLPILLLPSIAKADSVFLDGNYIKIQLQTAGVLGNGASGTGSNSNVMFRYDPNGQASFSSTDSWADLMQPGSPFEGFSITTEEDGTLLRYNNTNGSSPGIGRGTLTTVSDSNYDNHVRWFFENTSTRPWDITTDFYFDNNSEELTIKNQIKAYEDFDKLYYARFFDPDIERHETDNVVSGKTATATSTDGDPSLSIKIDGENVNVHAGSWYRNADAIYDSSSVSGDGRDDSIAVAQLFSDVLTGDILTSYIYYIAGRGIDHTELSKSSSRVYAANALYSNRDLLDSLSNAFVSSQNCEDHGFKFATADSVILSEEEKANKYACFFTNNISSFSSLSNGTSGIGGNGFSNSQLAGIKNYSNGLSNSFYLNYTTSDVDSFNIDNVTASLGNQSTTIGYIASKKVNGTNLELTSGFSFGNVNSSGARNYTGDSTSATADFSSTGYSFLLSAKTQNKVFSKQFKKSFYFSPYLAFGASYLSQNSFSETGSGSNLLSIKKVDSSIFDTEIGTSIASDPIKVGKSFKFYPRLAAAYRQSWGGSQTIQASKKGSSSYGNYSVNSSNNASMILKLGGDLVISKNSHIYTEIGYTASTNSNILSLNAGLSRKF